MSRVNDYYKLLELSYDEAVEHLLNKYGAVIDDYYREKSYVRFLKGEIKSVAKGKFTRTSDGLYTHHIDEFTKLNLANYGYIKQFKYSFEYQKKERLVYCDLIEHAILHVLIIKETHRNDSHFDPFEYSLSRPPGYNTHLQPNIILWYIDENIPKKQWEINCYNKAFLAPIEACNLSNYMDKIAGIDPPFVKSLEEYFERKRLLEEERLEHIRRRNERDREDYERLRLYAKELHVKSSRDAILNTLYNFKDREKRIDYKKFKKEMYKYHKEELLEQIHEYLEENIK